MVGQNNAIKDSKVVMLLNINDVIPTIKDAVATRLLQMQIKLTTAKDVADHLGFLNKRLRHIETVLLSIKKVYDKYSNLGCRSVTLLGIAQLKHWCAQQAQNSASTQCTPLWWTAKFLHKA